MMFTEIYETLTLVY